MESSSSSGSSSETSTSSGETRHQRPKKPTKKRSSASRNNGSSKRLKYSNQPAIPDLAPPEYNPPPASWFTLEECGQRKNRVTRELNVDAIIDHPLEAVVEYPETGRVMGESVAHRFAVDPTAFRHPKNNIQYSLGGGQGQYSVDCFMLGSESGQASVRCIRREVQCKSSRTSSDHAPYSLESGSKVFA